MSEKKFIGLIIELEISFSIPKEYIIKNLLDYKKMYHSAIMNQLCLNFTVHLVIPI